MNKIGKKIEITIAQPIDGVGVEDINMEKYTNEILSIISKEIVYAVDLYWNGNDGTAETEIKFDGFELKEEIGITEEIQEIVMLAQQEAFCNPENYNNQITPLLNNARLIRKKKNKITNEFEDDLFEMKLTPIEDFGHWNPYYNPEECGLELIDCLDLAEANYSFEYLCVWKEKITGDLYCAHDSGCSCPTPFEDYNKLSQLEIIRVETIKRVRDELRKNSYVGMERAQEFMYKIKKALNK